jgi:hypothetical protein
MKKSIKKLNKGLVIINVLFVIFVILMRLIIFNLAEDRAEKYEATYIVLDIIQGSTEIDEVGTVYVRPGRVFYYRTATDKPIFYEKGDEPYTFDNKIMNYIFTVQLVGSVLFVLNLSGILLGWMNKRVSYPYFIVSAALAFQVIDIKLPSSRMYINLSIIIVGSILMYFSREKRVKKVKVYKLEDL